MKKLVEKYNGTSLEMPGNLTATGKLAWATIIKTAGKHTAPGGCKTFYSPKEWADRGEEYGINGELIVVYDGGDLACWFNMDYGVYSMVDKMSENLDKVNLWTEPCTHWYSVVLKG